MAALFVSFGAKSLSKTRTGIQLSSSKQTFLSKLIP
jgi:hypothetical protein